MIAAASITVCMFTSCNGGLTEQSESDPAGTYRNYLLEVRKMKSISFEELSENLCQWQAIRDSVFNHVRQDTVGTHGQDLRKTCEGIHDSLRLEFSRLALSRPRSYQELFLLKRKLSSNDKDNGLIRTVEKIRPFFESLDKRPIHKGDRKQIISDYRTLLANTLRNGIHGTDDMTEFIGKEDAIFRAFLPYLCSIGDEDISDITRDTENAVCRFCLPPNVKRYLTRMPSFTWPCEPIADWYLIPEPASMTFIIKRSKQKHKPTHISGCLCAHTFLWTVSTCRCFLPKTRNSLNGLPHRHRPYLRLCAESWTRETTAWMNYPECLWRFTFTRYKHKIKWICYDTFWKTLWRLSPFSCHSCSM